MNQELILDGLFVFSAVTLVGIGLHTVAIGAVDWVQRRRAHRAMLRELKEYWDESPMDKLRLNNRTKDWMRGMEAEEDCPGVGAGIGVLIGVVLGTLMWAVLWAILS